MSEIWDDQIRRTTDTGDLYAYAFGVAQAIIANMGNGRYDVPTGCARIDQLRADVDRRVDELHDVAQARVESLELARGHAQAERDRAALSPIFVSDEKAGEHTSETDRVIEP